MQLAARNLLGLFVLSVLWPVQALALTGEEAREAVRRFIEAWNTREPAAFAATLQYPHVRPTADFDGRVFADAATYAAAIDFDQVLATGWDRTLLDSATVVQAGKGQAHVAGRYTRLRADGSAIWSNQITYVVAEKDGSIGIQARLAAGLDDLSESDREANAAAAVAAVESYLAAFNARDEVAMTDAMQFPHVRVGRGGVRTWSSGAEYRDTFDFDSFAERLGWEHSEADSMEPVQVGARGVNVAVRITRYAASDVKIHSFDTVYLVTELDGQWGIKAGASVAPSP
ncbi:MAG: hypothetical protein F4X59_01345 [Holophagales bacterium]|nr:hypothetical protein [Holophagales bacterium]MXX61258.1 hypothetical protein [Holophagales bacterium]MYC08753.1 hypothetical protein [Holophagales bacterium]MYD22044.1 hypothetical protein [Holophagales bacterium]MYI32893.1 hypothetical protein [Holophagales bacterium]